MSATSRIGLSPSNPWLMPAISLVVTVGFAMFGALLAFGLTSQNESTRERIASVERASIASVAAVRSELAAAQLLGRTQRENLERQMQSRDAEQERALREQAAQLQALSMTTAETRSLLSQLREMVVELRDTLRAWPMPERPAPSRRPV